MSEEEMEACPSPRSSILTEDIPDSSELRVDTMQLLNWIVDTDSDQIKPSEYRAQLDLSIKERYDSLVALSKRKPMPLDQFSTSSKFSTIPSLLLFQNFALCQTYKVNVRITNLLHTTQCLAISTFPLPASVFKITYDTKCGNLKVAPGMTLVLKVEFCPQQNTDLSTYLELKSNLETFQVPILALGPRPQLDLPDAVELSRTSPKIESERLVRVRNIGSVETEFSLTVQNPFSVSPSKAFLRPGEDVQVSMKCLSVNSGNFESKLLVKFETGELIAATIQCPSSNLKLSLSASRLDFRAVPVGLLNTCRFEIVNNSDRCIQFRWVKNSTLNRDLVDIEKLKGCCDLIKENEQLRSNVLRYQELVSEECHEAIYERLHADEIASLRPTDEQLFSFSSNVFQIEPLSGTVWPHTSVIVAVTFQPLECLRYQMIAYCDMTGHNARHGITFEGHGVGPKFTLSATKIVLDLFVCSTKKFEVYITNVGDIPGSINFPSQNLVFGGHISCSPDFAELEPLSSMIFRMEIQTEFVGDFTEQIRFRIVESNEELGFVLSGSVRSVSLTFSSSVIDFGNVSFGFLTSQTLQFKSDYPDPVPFEILLEEDGNELPVTHEDYLVVPYGQCGVPKYPRQFFIDPVAGVLKPGSCETIKITLTCNRFCRFSSLLRFKLLTLKSQSSVIPILYDCQACALSCEPKLRVYDLAFLRHEYSYEISLSNESPGQIVAFQHVPECNDKIQVCLSDNKGVLTSSKSILVTFMAKEIGPIECPIRFHTLGAESTMQCCMLEITGCGPLLSTSLESLEWGEIPLLRLGTKILEVRNESPIETRFSADFIRPCKYWSISPENGTIAPLSTLDIAISITPVESGPVSNTLCIQGRDFDSLKVKVSATGVGHSIIVKPNIIPDYDFGYVLTDTTVSFPITLHNFGAKTYELLWSSNPRSSGALYRQSHTTEHLTWNISPSKFRLGPGKEVEARVDVYSETPREASAEFYLLGFVHGDKMNLHNILKTSWRVVFITSTLLFTPEQLLFRVDHVSPDIRCVDSTDIIELFNPTENTLYTKIQVRYPFYLTCDQRALSTCEMTQADQSLEDLTKEELSTHRDQDLDNKSMSSETISSLNDPLLDYKSSGSQPILDSQLKESPKDITSNDLSGQMLESSALDSTSISVLKDTLIRELDPSQEADSTEEISLNWTNRRILRNSMDEMSHSASNTSMHENVHVNVDSAMQIYLPYDKNSRKTEFCCVLESNARFKFNVHFDADSCSETLSSYVIQDFVFLQYKGVKVEDKIPLVAVINYPSIDLNPRSLNYQTVSLYQHQGMQVILTNTSPFPVEYSFSWSADEWTVSYSKCDDIFVKKFKHELKKYSIKDRRFQSQPQKFKQKVPPVTSLPPGKSARLEETEGTAATSQASHDNGSSSNVTLTEALLIDPHQTLSEHIVEITNKFVENVSEMTLQNHKHKIADYKKLVNMIIDKRFNRTDLSTQVSNQIMYIVQALCTEQDRHLYRMEYTELNRNMENDDQRNVLNTYFSFSPSSGTVGPYQTQIIEACFYPKYGVDIKGKALCNITGGLPQELAIQAAAHDDYYTVKPMVIDLKCIKFGEKHHGKFKIFNKGHGPIRLDQSFLPISKHNTRVHLTFATLLLQPQSSTSVQVEYWAHIVGLIQETFYLIVAHQPPLEMLLTGFSIFPQAMLHTRRALHYSSLPPKHEYIALARYLHFCDYKPGPCRPSPRHIHNKTQESSRRSLKYHASEMLRRNGSSVNSIGLIVPFLDNSWEFFANDTNMPSTSAIQATLERASVAKYELKRKPTHVITEEEFWPVKVAPYVVDFHNITAGESHVHSIVVSNPSHLAAHILLNKAKDYAYLGLTLLLKGEKKLGGNNVLHLVVNFTPSKTVFKKHSQSVQYSLSVKVKGGLCIEIIVKATVCVPYLAVNPCELDFKTIRVNCVYNQFFSVENKGPLRTRWKLSQKHRGVLGDSVEPQDVVIATKEGVVNPGDIQFIHVVVHSNSPVTHKLDYVLHIENVSEPIKIKVLANIVEPTVVITRRKLDFGIRHPYALEEGLISELQNRNPFPVEIILQYPRQNSDYLDEVKLLDVLFSYYNNEDSLLIPSTYDENNFTPVLNTFYKRLQGETLEWLNKKHTENLPVAVEDTENETSRIKEEIPESKAAKNTEKTKGPSAGKSGRLSRRQSTLGIKSNISKVALVASPIVSEIIVRDEDIREYIDYLKENNLLQDPLGLYPTTSSPDTLTPGPEDMRGVCIICYAAPENGKMYATQLANQLNLDCINIDDLAIDTLMKHAGSNDELCMRITEWINKSYDTIMSRAVPNKPSSNTLVTAKVDAVPDQIGLRNKIECILSYRPSTITSPNAQAANKKSKRSLPEETASSFSLDLAVFEEMMSQLLLADGGIPDRCQSRGVVIADLESRVFRNIVNLFLLLLKLVTPSVKHVQLVVFHNSKDAYKMKQKELNDLSEIHNQKMMMEKRKQLQSITPAQHAKLTESERDIYRKILEERIQERKQRDAGEDENATNQSIPDTTMDSTRGKPPTIKKSKTSKNLQSSRLREELPEIAETPPTTESLLLSHVSSQFDQYQLLLSRLIKMAELWHSNMENVLSLGQMTQESSTPNLNKGKSKASLSATKKNVKEPTSKVEQTTKETDKPTGQADNSIGLPVFIVNTQLESLVAFYHLSDILERKKNAELLANQRSRIPTLPNFWYLRKPELSILQETNVNSETPFCLQSPLLISDTSVRLSSDAQVISDTDGGTSAFNTETPVSNAKITVGKSSTKLKKSPKPGKTKEEEEPSQLISPKKTQQCETKLIKFALEPFGKLPLTFSFSPHQVGQYEQNFEFMLNNYRTKSTIKCTGVCILPDIDRKPGVIYPKVIEYYSDLSTHNVFVLKTGIFFFGYVLVTDTSSGNVVRQEAELIIRNASAVSPVTVHFYWKSRQEATPEDEFGLDVTDIMLQPRESRKLKVWAAPHEMGSRSDEIIYCIDENPNAGSMNLVVNGVTADFSIEPTIIKLQRSLLYHTYSAYFRLSNRSPVSLHWSFHSMSSPDTFIKLTDEISISKIEGEIRPLQLESVKVTYSPQTVDQRKLDIWVYVTDHLQRKLVLEPQMVTIVWESFDVAVDLELPDARRLLDFGRVLYGSTVERTVKVKNKGVFDLAFTMDALEHDCSKGISFSPKSVFKMDSSLSDLLSDKNADVVITAHTLELEGEITLDRKDVIRVLVTDRVDKENLIAILPIPVSIKVETPCFFIVPPNELHFGPLLLNQTKTLHFQISNSGLFSFDFWFSVPESKLKSNKFEQRAEDHKSKAGNVAGMNTRKNKVEKDDSMKFDEATSLIIYPFVITMKSGTVLPNQVLSIPVTCSVDAQMSYFEMILCNISNEPRGFEPVALQLSAKGQLPELKLDSLHFIFQEANIFCSSFECLTDVAEDFMTSYTAFAADDKTLLFANVPITETCHINVHLYNSSQVPAEVLILVTLAASDNATGYGKSVSKSTTRRKDRLNPEEPSTLTQDDVFDMDSKEFIVAPHSLKKVPLYFKPALIQEYRGTVSIILPARAMTEQFAFSVLGQVTVPQISILKPNVDDDEKYKLTMNPTLLGMRSFQSFRVQNTCKVLVHVILEIFKNENDAFSMAPSKDTVPMVLMDSDEILHTMLMDMKPGAVAEFIVQFKPLVSGKSSGEIHLYIRNNAYEKLVILSVGIGHDDHIHIHGLEFQPIVSRITPNSTSASILKSPSKKIDKKSIPDGQADESETPTHEYWHDFGAFPLEREMWHSFQMGNTAKDGAFRYVFTWDRADMTVFPSLGHLGPGTSRTFVIAVKCREPSYGEEHIKCILTPIALETPGEENWSLSHSTTEEINLLNAIDVATKRKDADTKDGAKKHVTKPRLTSSTVTAAPSVENPFAEPNYTVLKEHEPIPLTINVKFVSDYVKYVVAEKHLDFSFCPCYQDKVMQVKVMNTGPIPVNIKSCLLLENYHQIASTGTTDLVAISSTPIEQSIMNALAESFATSANAEMEGRVLNVQPNYLSSDPKYISNNSVSETQSREAIKATDSMRESQLGNDLKSLALPFSTSPSGIVSIDPGQSFFFDLKFSPIRPYSYEAELSFHTTPMEITAEGDQRTCTLEGTGLMPWVHLELSEEDMIVTSQAQKLHTGVRCLAFHDLGENITHVMNVKMTNITASPLSYSWRDVTDQSDPCNHAPLTFGCTHDSDLLLPGCQTTVLFTFHPYNLGDFESRWKLLLSEDQSVDFLIVGVAREPLVRLNRNFLKLSCFVGALSTGTILIKNKESCDLNYEFVATSLYNEGRQETLLVEPSSGVLKSKSSTRIRIGFTADSSGDFLFNVKCAVTHILSPLLLCVSCQVFPVRVQATLISVLGEHFELCPDEDNVILVGKINIQMPVTYEYQISNEDTKSVTYSWSHEDHNTLLDIDVASVSGRIEPLTTHTDSLSLLAHRNCVFDDETLVLHIHHGPRYVIKFKGIAHNLPYNIWPKVVNFGSCPITGKNDADGVEQHTKYTRIVNCKNHSQENMDIECNNQDMPSLHVNVVDHMIEPNCTGKIQISFNPLHPKTYREVINLLINGKYPEIIKVFGKGVELKVRLANGEKAVDFGLMKVGSLVKRTLELINQSEGKVSVRFDLCAVSQPTLIPTKSPQEGSENQARTQCCATNDMFNVLPQTLELEANETKSITVQCKPTMIEKDIKLWLILHFESIKKNLCLIKGSVIGVSFLLDRDLLSFNPTKRKCTSVEKIVLINNGDVGSKFEWSISQTSNYFKISPNRGFSNAGSVVHFNVEFSPSRPMLYLSCKAICKLEKHTSLELTLSGSCVAHSKIKDIMEFSTPVRTAAREIIQLDNSPVEPVITGFFFSGVKKLLGEKTFSYEVTYAPQHMTVPSRLHHGYIKLCSDNTVIRLTGKTLPPLPNETIVASLPALQPYIQLLRALNWLPYSQKFKCYFEFLPNSVGSIVENYFNAKMIESITLPASTDRNVDFYITPYRSGKLHIKVFLENEGSKEYQWWDLNYDILSHEYDLETVIDLTSYARQTLYHTLVLENPMEESTVFTASCNHADLTVPDSVTVPGKQKGHLKVEYTPVLAGDEQEVSMEVTSPELGRTIYHFRLLALEPPVEREIKFSAELGKSVTQTVYLENLSTRPKTEFSLQVTHPDFIVDKAVQVLQGVKVSVNITYEPTSLEGCEAVLEAKSQHAGVYTYSLLGEAFPPKPQGPYTIAPGDSVVIPFKNIFNEAKTFSFVVDNPLFSLKPTTEVVKNKKDTKITVTLAQSPELDCSIPIVAKLTASVAGDDRAEYAHMKWHFYLNTQC